MNRGDGSNQKGTALVTGASSGIGQAVCEMLWLEGYEVYGFGRTFISGKVHQENGQPALDTLWSRKGMHQIVCDLLDTRELEKHIREIQKKEQITMLVNNAGVAYYGLHEELNPKKIQEMVRTNLELPMVLTNLLLRDLKEYHGAVVNISSVTAKEASPHGCAYAATKAGLSSFSASLFAEARKRGVRVINIQPDMTETALYRNADFETDEDISAKLLPEEIAEVIRFAITRREGMAMTDFTVRPQLHRLKRKT